MIVALVALDLNVDVGFDTLNFMHLVRRMMPIGKKLVQPLQAIEITLADRHHL